MYQAINALNQSKYMPHACSVAVTVSSFDASVTAACGRRSSVPEVPRVMVTVASFVGGGFILVSTIFSTNDASANFEESLFAYVPAVNVVDDEPTIEVAFCGCSEPVVALLFCASFDVGFVITTFFSATMILFPDASVVATLDALLALLPSLPVAADDVPRFDLDAVLLRRSDGVKWGAPFPISI